MIVLKCFFFFYDLLSRFAERRVVKNCSRPNIRGFGGHTNAVFGFSTGEIVQNKNAG